MRERSSAMPWSVTRPSRTKSGSPWNTDSGNSSPRGILMPNSRSKRNTMSRKSIDSAPRSPCSVESGFTSDSSTFKASTSVFETFWKISSFCMESIPLRKTGGTKLQGWHAEAQAAVHGDDLACDVRRRGAGQEHRQLGNVRRRPEALGGDHLLDRFPCGVAYRLAHVGLNE